MTSTKPITPRDQTHTESRRTIVVDPGDIVRALEHNHLKATDGTRLVLVDMEAHRTSAEYIDLALMDPLPSGVPETRTLIHPSAFIRNSLKWARPPTRAEIKSELGGSFGSEHEVDELHARCISGWRNQVRMRIADSVFIEATGEVANVEISVEQE